MSKYLISDFCELNLIPQLNNLKITTKYIRSTELVATIVEISYKTNVIYSMPTDCSISTNARLFTKEEVCDVINSLGFNIEFINRIKLSSKELDILTSLYKLDYSYIQRRPINQIDQLIISNKPVTTESSNTSLKLLSDFVSIDISKMFLWVKPLECYSIPRLINLHLDGDTIE